MKNKFLLREIRKQLAVELQYSLPEVQSLLKILTELTPELVTIFPSDDLVNTETLLVNLDAPVSLLMEKFRGFIQQAQNVAVVSAETNY